MIRLFLKLYGVLIATLAVSFVVQVQLMDYAWRHIAAGADAREARLLTYAINWAVEFLIVAVLVFFWVRPFWRDLRALHAAAEAIGQGRLHSRVSVGRFSALRPFAGAFNAMAGRIGALVQSHRSLTSAVSHEVRTPLSRLQFAQSLALEEPSATLKDAWLERMGRDIRQIDELTAELLGYARLECESPPLQLETVPAEPWLEDMLAGCEGPGPTGPVVVRSAVMVESIRCEPRYLARAAANLVRNARMHARQEVRVSLLADGGRTCLQVDDDGPGISAGERERVFEPFVRLDRSRSRDTGGFGLGLAIARQIARWHGGEAIASESPLGGARITLCW